MNTVSKMGKGLWLGIALLASAFAMPALAQLSGAIYTTTFQGTTVNQNLYHNRHNVYLNGGPQNTTGSGLTVGIYYYQVTNPSGSLLLSQDNYECRQLEVKEIAGQGRVAGRYNAGGTIACAHPNGFTSLDNGSTGVKLMPFSLNPNQNEYKVWMIKKECAVLGQDGLTLGAGGGCEQKTDNFKVEEDGFCTAEDPNCPCEETEAGCPPPPCEDTPEGCPEPPCEDTPEGCPTQCTPGDCTCDLIGFPNGCVTPNQFTVGGLKCYDVNANGVCDSTEAGIVGLKLLLTIDPDGPGEQLPTTTEIFTGEDGVWTSDLLDPIATYEVCEVLPATSPGWLQTAPLDDALSLTGSVFDDPNAVTQRCWEGTASANDVDLDFGNLCLGAGNGFTKGYWHNKNGLNAINDCGGIGPLLSYDGNPITLRNQDGTVFTPTTVNLSGWLKSANASNMSNMLSAQFAAMLLNVACKKDGDDDGMLYAPGTDSANSLGYARVGDLFMEAIALLNANGEMRDGHPDRARAGAVKDAFDSANNNQNWVQPTQATCGAITYVAQ